MSNAPRPYKDDRFSMTSGGQASPAMIASLFGATSEAPTTAVADRMKELGLVPNGATVNAYGKIIYPDGSMPELAVNAPFTNLGIASDLGTFNNIVAGGPHDPKVEAEIARELEFRRVRRQQLGLNGDGIPLSVFETADAVPAAIQQRLGVNVAKIEA